MSLADEIRDLTNSAIAEQELGAKNEFEKVWIEVVLFRLREAANDGRKHVHINVVRADQPSYFAATLTQLVQDRLQAEGFQVRPQMDSGCKFYGFDVYWP